MHLMTRSSWRAYLLTLIACAFATTLSSTACGGEACDGDDCSVPIEDRDGDQCTEITGEPIADLPDKDWTWVDVPGTTCLDGSETGFGVYRNSESDKLFIFLQPGGACFDAETCQGTFAQVTGVPPLDHFAKSDFDSLLSSIGVAALFAGTPGAAPGIFNTLDPNNPFKDWNMVYVPYCSGDVHAGNTDSGWDGKPQKGYQNVAAHLQRLVPTFANLSQVVLTGSSAGGFGSMMNFDQTQRAFCDVPVYALNDSGQPFRDDYLDPCLQKTWRDLWNLNAALPTECTDCSLDNGGGLSNLIPYLAKTYPDNRFGVISTTQDATIRDQFFNYTFNAASSTCERIAAGLDPATFAAGVKDMQDNLIAPTVVNEHGWRAFIVADDPTTTGAGNNEAEGHTFLLAAHLNFDLKLDSDLADWIQKMIDDDPSWDNSGKP